MSLWRVSLCVCWDEYKFFPYICCIQTEQLWPLYFIHKGSVCLCQPTSICKGVAEKPHVHRAVSHTWFLTLLWIIIIQTIVFFPGSCTFFFFSITTMDIQIFNDTLNYNLEVVAAWIKTLPGCVESHVYCQAETILAIEKLCTDLYNLTCVSFHTSLLQVCARTVPIYTFLQRV